MLIATDELKTLKLKNLLIYRVLNKKDFVENWMTRHKLPKVN
jgi:hypothetical protein